RALPDLPLRAAGGIVAVVGVCTLLAMFCPDWVTRPIWGPGGHAGAMGRHFAEGYFAKTGAAIVVTAVTGAGLFLTCVTLVLRAVAGLVAIAGGVAAALVACLTSFRARVASRPGLAAEQGDGDAGIATAYPGLRQRIAGAADEGELDDDDEPAIRVRRREKPLAVPEDELQDELEDDGDSLEVAADEDGDGIDAEDDAAEAQPEARPAVPIKSLAQRRRKTEPLHMAPDPTADYELPSLELLLPAEQLQLEQQEQEVRDRARVLEKTFADFGFKVRVVEIETGPVISQYEIELEAGLRLAKLANLADDLAIALRVPSVRIVAPIPGKNSVGIEVPNTDRQM
ncbi:MAG: DNA translocase FtsK, partial [Planctomycetia bacterium]